MTLLNRLRPKWQNSDPDVRATAVRNLEKDEIELLTAVAQGDEDARVRRIAIKKIDAPRSLLEIAASESDESNRDFARQRASQILVQIANDERDLEESKRALGLLTDPGQIIQVADKAHFDEVKRLAFAHLSEDESSLGEFVKHTTSAELRERAFERIESKAVLKSLALETSLGPLSLGAVDRIDDIEILESISTQRTASKSVRRHAGARLDDLIDDDHPIRVQERDDIFQRLVAETAGLTEALTPDKDRWTALQAEWNDTAKRGHPASALGARYEELKQSLQARFDKSEQSREPRNARQASEPADVESTEPRTEPLELDKPEPSAPTPTPSPETNDGVVAPDDDQNRNAEAQKAQDPNDGASAEHALEQARTLLASAEELPKSSDGPALNQTIAAYRRLEASFKKLGRTPEGDASEWSPLTESFRAVGQSLKEQHDALDNAQRKLEKTNLQTLDTHCANIERFMQADNLSLKKANDELRRAQDFLKDMGPLPAGVSRKKQRQRLRDLRETLFKRVHEAQENEDWKRWANADIQTALIQKLESFHESRDYPKIAKEMRAIHEQWRKAGAAPSAKAEKLWARYRELREELNGRCEEFFKKQDAQRVGNLEKKEALCVRAEALKESEDWNKTANALRELQTEWKAIGPVPQKKSDAVWQRFRSACNSFFERRKEVLDSKMAGYKENLAKKVALCEQAESLQDSTDWRETADTLKRLQAEWKSGGPVPRKKSDAIWNRFRTACDHFFDRFKRRDEIGLELHAERAEELLSKLSTEALDAADAETAGSLALEQWNAWKGIGQLPSQGAPDLWKRFRESMSRFLDKAVDAASLKRTEIDPASVIKKLEKLCEKVDKLVEDYTASETNAPGNLDDLAAQLKNALASNTIAGAASQKSVILDWREGANQIQRVKETWSRSVPLRKDLLAPLSKRFESACAAFDKLRRGQKVMAKK